MIFHNVPIHSRLEGEVFSAHTGKNLALRLGADFIDCREGKKWFYPPKESHIKKSSLLFSGEG